MPPPLASYHPHAGGLGHGQRDRGAAALPHGLRRLGGAAPTLARTQARALTRTLARALTPTRTQWLAVNLVTNLVATPAGWAAPLHATLSRALGHVPDVVALLQADPTAQGLTDAGMLPAAFQV